MQEKGHVPKRNAVDTIARTGLILCTCTALCLARLVPSELHYCILTSETTSDVMQHPSLYGGLHDHFPPLFHCSAFTHYLSLYIFTVIPSGKTALIPGWFRSFSCGLAKLSCSHCLLVFGLSPTFYNVSSQGQEFCLVHHCIPGRQFHYRNFPDAQTKARGMESLGKSQVLVSARDILRTGVLLVQWLVG